MPNMGKTDARKCVNFAQILEYSIFLHIASITLIRYRFLTFNCNKFKLTLALILLAVLTPYESMNGTGKEWTARQGERN